MGKSQINNLIKPWQGARTLLLTNQSAYSPEEGYHYQVYMENLHLIYIAHPEHGLFGELQDQESGEKLKYNLKETTPISLYGESYDSLFLDQTVFKNIDLVIIDIKDIGSRYFTYANTALYIMRSLETFLKENSSKTIQTLVVDYDNPVGKKVEGTPLQPEFESFVGSQGILHRHGLSIGKLLQFQHKRHNFSFPFELLDYPSPGFYIPPSPNMPKVSTCEVYPGQCLLEGTNISEGRGTTSPFEFFGAPFLKYDDQTLSKKLLHFQKNTFVLRPLVFIPVFHKHTGVQCKGYQLIITDNAKFHSLFFGLYMIRTIREHYENDFHFLEGKYEKGNEKNAIELLVGDRFLLTYLNGKVSHKEVLEYLNDHEQDWKKKFNL